MDLNKTEVAVIEKAIDTDVIQLLDDLQLALVGGGIGETIL